MSELMVTAARMIARATPFPAVRSFYFKAFCKWVWGRKVRATVEGVTFDLDLRETLDVAIYAGGFERDVANAIKRYCRPGWCALDIGANVGAHTMRLARMVGPEGRVIAFEPTTYAYAKLTKNIALNAYPNIRSIRVALSNLNLEKQKIAFRSSWPSAGARLDGPCTVDFRRLDDWATENQLDQVDIIKIDVDGAEFEVFEGAYQLLSRCRPIFIAEAGAWHFSNPSRRPYHLLHDLGYRFLDAVSLEPYASPTAIAQRLPATDEAMTFSLNVIAVPPAAACR